MSISKIKEINKKFDEKVNELRNTDYKSEKPVYFGYRYANAVGDEIYTATDYGNIKKFYTQQILSLIEELEGKKKKEKKVEMYLCQSYYNRNNKLTNCTCGKCI